MLRTPAPVLNGPSKGLPPPLSPELPLLPLYACVAELADVIPAELVLVLVKEVVRVVVWDEDEIEVDDDDDDSVAELLAEATVELADLALPEAAAVDVLVAVSEAIDIEVEGLGAAVVMVVVVGDDVGVQRKEMRFPTKI